MLWNVNSSTKCRLQFRVWALDQLSVLKVDFTQKYGIRKKSGLQYRVWTSVSRLKYGLRNELKNSVLRLVEIWI